MLLLQPETANPETARHISVCKRIILFKSYYTNARRLRLWHGGSITLPGLHIVVGNY